MPLSSLPNTGPSIPLGAKTVTVKDVDVTASAAKEDVSDLSSTEREYAAPVLVEGGSGAATKTCSASGILKGTAPEPTPIATTTGWVCEETEVTYEVGKYATWSASWSYYPS